MLGMASVVQHDPSQSSGQRHGLKAKDRTRDISVHTYSLIVSQTVSLIQSVKHSSNTKQKCKQSEIPRILGSDAQSLKCSSISKCILRVKDYIRRCQTHRREIKNTCFVLSPPPLLIARY